MQREIIRPRSELFIERSLENPFKEAFQLAIANYKSANEAAECWFNDDNFLKDHVSTFFPRRQVYPQILSIKIFMNNKQYKLIHSNFTHYRRIQAETQTETAYIETFLNGIRMC